MYLSIIKNDKTMKKASNKIYKLIYTSIEGKKKEAFINASSSAIAATKFDEMNLNIKETISCKHFGNGLLK